MSVRVSGVHGNEIIDNELHTSIADGFSPAVGKAGSHHVVCAIPHLDGTLIPQSQWIHFKHKRILLVCDLSGNGPHGRNHSDPVTVGQLIVQPNNLGL